MPLQVLMPPTTTTSKALRSVCKSHIYKIAHFVQYVCIDVSASSLICVYVLLSISIYLLRKCSVKAWKYHLLFIFLIWMKWNLTGSLSIFWLLIDNLFRSLLFSAVILLLTDLHWHRLIFMTSISAIDSSHHFLMVICSKISSGPAKSWLLSRKN